MQPSTISSASTESSSAKRRRAPPRTGRTLEVLPGAFGSLGIGWFEGPPVAAPSGEGWRSSCCPCRGTLWRIGAGQASASRAETPPSRPGCALSAVPRATGSGSREPERGPRWQLARDRPCRQWGVTSRSRRPAPSVRGACGARRAQGTRRTGPSAATCRQLESEGTAALIQQQTPSVRSVRARLGRDLLAVAPHEVADRRRRTILRMTEVHPGAPGFAASGFLRLRRADERSPAPDGTTVDSWISHRAASSSSVCP